ncbi:MAG TPA: glycine cleavage system aminomethyltransferase GcvT [Solirubrobacteraceae bacterium]|nr:glycine cleavage system aminomethyltransferase GcvT [Solirubrobacteraceae bacterium]
MTAGGEKTLPAARAAGDVHERPIDGKLARTPLSDVHVAAGARMAPFAGFSMPLHYPGASPLREEHMAVREHAGLFDVSHMGEIELSGAGAQRLLQRVLSNDIERTAGGRALYALLCNREGGVLEDLIAYRLEDERHLLITNAANHRRDLEWLRACATELELRGDELEIEDAADRYALLALQGPAARQLLAPLCDGEAPARMHARPGTVAGVPALICATGYTGEDGFELLCAPELAPELWRALIGAGARPAGLAARDSLRIEACLPLYGNELSEARNPIEAGLGAFCKEETGFIGAGAVRRAREQGTAERLVPFRLLEAGIARAGNPIAGGGVVTSGTLSPLLGSGIGLAYVPSESAKVGSELVIDVRGRLRRAVVAARPLFR